MQPNTKAMIVIICLLAFSFTGIVSSQAGSGSNQPASTPTVKYLPDLKPVQLYFDQNGNMMVEIKNAGQRKVSGNIHYALYVSGKIFSSGPLGNVVLIPGYKVTKQIPREHLPAPPHFLWKYKLVLDPDNKIKESNENNNSFQEKMKMVPKKN